jgi:hypothetical protein
LSLRNPLTRHIGTLKKLYLRAESYTTLLIANYLAHTLSFIPEPTSNTEPGGASTREAKVRQGETEAWRERRGEVIKALKAVDES